MPFGVRNAPATFQRLVNKVLAGVSCCDPYLDDIVVYSESWGEHISRLQEVFLRLTEANLTLNLAKCEFGQATVIYLGKVVGRGQVKPVHGKIEAILSFPDPSSGTMKMGAIVALFRVGYSCCSQIYPRRGHTQRKTFASFGNIDFKM